jgi:phosphoribosyl 1,2-cyclic phosphodiesterase
VTPAVRTRNILIDCGKYFWSAALKTFPKAGIDHLDAVILTHAHADAFFGVDDLRDFSNLREGGAALPVFVREQDIPEIRKAFPYLMNKGQTTNNMHVPALEFMIYDEQAPFQVCGLTITPLQVDHGPGVTCSAFSFGDSIYMSDVNEIPDSVRAWINSTFHISTTSNGTTSADVPKRSLDILVLDALWPTRSYNSHFSLQDAIREFQAFRPRKGYTTGMSHEIEHNEGNKVLSQVSSEHDLDLELAWDGLSVELRLPETGSQWRPRL